MTRQRHPFEGQSLAVLGWMHRHRSLELLLILPDGSRSLIPAAWTDLDPPSQDKATEGILASPFELLRARTIVDALLRRVAASKPESAPDSTEEEERATDFRVCDDEPARSATGGVAKAQRRRTGRRRGDAGPVDGPNARAKGGIR
ncbi:MAG: hypothetical protein GY769_23250 [bacterium]|nr:hypothetical protein [bacterium]